MNITGINEAISAGLVVTKTWAEIDGQYAETRSYIAKDSQGRWASFPVATATIPQGHKIVKALWASLLGGQPATVRSSYIFCHGNADTELWITGLAEPVPHVMLDTDEQEAIMDQNDAQAVNAEWPNMCPNATTCKNFSMGLDCPTAASPAGPSDLSCFEPKDAEPTATIITASQAMPADDQASIKARIQEAYWDNRKQGIDVNSIIYLPNDLPHLRGRRPRRPPWERPGQAHARGRARLHVGGRGPGPGHTA